MSTAQNKFSIGDNQHYLCLYLGIEILFLSVKAKGLALMVYFNITLSWLQRQHACWRFTPYQFVLMIILSSEQCSQFERFRLQHVPMVNKTCSFKKITDNNAEASRINRSTLWCLTFPRSRHNSTLHVTNYCSVNRACKWVTIHGVTPRDWSLLGTMRD